MTADELWKRMVNASGLHKGTIRRYLTSSDVVRDVSIDDDVFVIRVSDPYFKRWIESRLIMEWTAVCPFEIRVVAEEREKAAVGEDDAQPWWVN